MIPSLAVYRVIHSPHRADHFAILRRGDRFPRCQRCGEDVRFEITDLEALVDSDAIFYATRIYEIPHPDPQGEQDREIPPGEKTGNK